MQDATYVSQLMINDRMSCRFWVNGDTVKYKIEAVLQYTASSALNDKLITIDDKVIRSFKSAADEMNTKRIIETLKDSWVS
jgi:hypothetical protein